MCKLKLLFNIMLRIHVPNFRWIGHIEFQRDGVLEKHNTKVSLWELKKIVSCFSQLEQW
jgi:hypothetical protein